jgi:hypothetical protein
MCSLLRKIKFLKNFNLNNCYLKINDKKVIKGITDKIKNLPTFLSRLGEAGIPMTCLKDVFLP